MNKGIKIIAGLAIAAAMHVSGSGSAWSADAYVKAPPVDIWSPWMIRGRALIVVPDASATLSVPGSVTISTSVVPELDITYFFTPNIAAEIILGVTPHSIDGAGALAGVPVGRAWLLPPTVLFQYHFTGLGAFKPYIGAGPNYTIFFNERAAGGVITQMDIKNNFGVAVQAGFDYMLSRHWGINVDVKKLFLRTDVSLNNGAITGRVKIDPWIIGTGLTYRF
jgi:outer membrane protein